MSRHDDARELRKLAAERQERHGLDDELAQTFLRIAAKCERPPSREPGEDG